MSAERDHASMRLMLACALAMPSWGALAQVGPPDEGRSAGTASDVQRISIPSPNYPYLIKDPLGARPSRLDSNTPLPGDATAIDCSNPSELPTRPLALADAVDLALCNSPQVKVSWAAIKIQAAAVGQSRATWLPTANATFSRLHSQTTYPSFSSSNTSSDGYTAFAGVTWRLFDFGARSADNKSAARLLDAALANHDAALEKTLGGVVQAYFDASTARASVQSRGDATGYAEQTWKAAARREAKGVSAASDTLQARAALAKARLAEQRAIGDLHKAMSVLLYACGLPPQAEVQLAAEPESEPAQALSDLSNWLTMTAERHPAILAAQAQVESAEAKVDVARRQGLPSIDFSANYYRNGYPNQGLQPVGSSTKTVGITLNIPLFEGLARTYQVRSAQAQVDQSRAQLQDVRLQMASMVVKDHAEATAALSNLEASATWVEAASAAVESARNRYDKGAGDVLELLAAQSALSDARQERLRCLAEWRSARLRLFADSGTLGRSELMRTPGSVPESASQ
ncbi:MAG: TolC family protein [Burkholderiaceae bacterium]